MVNVHYIFDPMCGWCFGAATLIESLSNNSDINLQLHPGGMRERAPIEDSFRQHILAADQTIADQTGQTFGQAYLDRVASDQPVILDSFITAQAILATQQIDGQGAEMLKRIQQGHYQQGRSVYEADTLAVLASEMEIDAETWQQAMNRAENDVMPAVNQTRQLMAAHGLRGFPSMLVEQNGQWQVITVSQYYRRPDAWQALWQQLTQA
ncbi:DsbA family protein [Salinivibrio socompensis]|uniref:DsbA family protein n=1 Tax=Salinivibrio socompensis TaxID=1510206 RepID=UPI000471EDA9|nr:DsbA family protein [Salinivibrio socompensis]